MKTFIKNKIKYLAALCGIVCALSAPFACSDMNELSDQFLNGGEKIYAARVDSVIPHAGYEQLELEVFVSNTRTDTVKVYWDNYQKHADIPVNSSSGVFTKAIDGLVEGSYLFQVVSLDPYGNRSLPVEVSGTVFGANFTSLLRNRNVVGMSVLRNGELTIKWGSSVTYGVECVASYINTSDQTVTLHVPMTETENTVISDFKSGLSYYTVFMAEPTAMETFQLDPVNVTVWSATTQSVHAYGSQVNADNAATKAVDGNITNRWHSTNTANPEYIAVALGSTITIDRLVIWPSIYDRATAAAEGRPADARFPTKFSFEVSMDGASWTDRVEFTFPASKLWEAGERIFDLPAPVQASYYKITGLEYDEPNPKGDWGSGYIVLGEIDVYEQR
ncbi:MAG: discoidin domain-containing protein [Bacteroidales bacterium]|jgi:hypothetical protein|nr:discoidin domain-containing protein [Bacteroidales bacterium]